MLQQNFRLPGSRPTLVSVCPLRLASPDDIVLGTMSVRNKYEKRTHKGSFFILVAGPGLAPGSAGYEPTEILLLHPATGHSTTVFSTLQAHICFYAIFCYILWIVGVAQLVERGTHKPKAVGS